MKKLTLVRFTGRRLVVVSVLGLLAGISLVSVASAADPTPATVTVSAANQSKFILEVVTPTASFGNVDPQGNGSYDTGVTAFPDGSTPQAGTWYRAVSGTTVNVRANKANWDLKVSAADGTVPAGWSVGSGYLRVVDSSASVTDYATAGSAGVQMDGTARVWHAGAKGSNQFTPAFLLKVPWDASDGAINTTVTVSAVSN